MEEDIKKSNKKFIIGYIIFVVVLAIITILASYFTLDNLNKDTKANRSQVNSLLNVRNIKQEAEDKKYAITSYSETYNMNADRIIKYYDADGEIYTDYPTGVEINVEYIQIYGLKDSNIQNKINKILKDESYNIGGKYVYADVTANFSNILSVRIINNDGKAKGLNFDLTTGDNIPLEKVFISSAMINSYLTDGLYEALAWSTLSFNNEFSEQNDMRNVDTSDYEDKFIMFINNYNNNKDNINYSIYTNCIYIYDLADKDILKTDYESSVKIDLVKHAKEVAIYKRYLTEESIFQDNFSATRDIIVFTNYQPKTEAFEYLTYGKIADNIFAEEILYQYNDELENKDKIIDYAKELSEKTKNDLKNQTASSKGLFYQRSYYLSKNENEDYITLNVYTRKTKCARTYFDDEGFKDYIETKNNPAANGEIIFFSDYMRIKLPKLEILDAEEKKLYFNLDGEYLGDTEDVVKPPEPVEELLENNTEDSMLNGVIQNILKERMNNQTNNQVNNTTNNQVNNQTNNQVNTQNNNQVNNVTKNETNKTEQTTQLPSGITITDVPTVDAY